MVQKYNALQLHENDNVAVALQSLRVNDTLFMKSNHHQSVQVLDNIPYGHKVALCPIRENEKILKYGECMGIATTNIEKGSHVHLSNVRGLTESDKEQLNQLARLEGEILEDI